MSSSCFAGFLIVALQNYWHCAAPLKVTMPILKQVRLAIPLVRRVWSYAIGPEKERTYKFNLEIEKQFQEALDGGMLDLNAPVAPEGYVTPLWEGGNAAA